jgi:hypothetical protein
MSGYLCPHQPTHLKDNIKMCHGASYENMDDSELAQIQWLDFVMTAMSYKISEVFEKLKLRAFKF